MARNNPCLFCKERRRKCEREVGATSCKRCAKRNIQCILYNPQHKSYSLTEDPNDIPSTTAVSLYEEIRDMERQIQQLNLELEQQKVLKKEPTWTVNVVNGKLLLESKIRTLEEFLLFGKSAIKYLSPFGNTFQTTFLEFKQLHISVLRTAMQAVSKFYRRDAATPQFDLLLSQRTIKQPAIIYKQLVDNYFNCFNDAVPILHEPSYRKHLNNLTDPLSDAATLAICAASSILTCKHSILHSLEKRYFGEYFYGKAIEILVDIFDDPDRSFESLIVINLLQMFLSTTLRFEESKKWGTIAILLCHNLHKEVGDFTSGGPHLPKGTRIKYAQLHRNYTVSQWYLDLVDFALNSKSESPQFFNNKKFDILPDESLKIRQLIEMINEVLMLMLDHSFITVHMQTKLMAMGEQAQLSFEQVIRYEETISDWWHDLPEKFKICPDPLSLTSSIIDCTTDIVKLLMACYFHTFNISTQALLVQPKYKKDIDSLNHILKGRAMESVIYSADMLLQLAKRIEALDKYCFSPSKLFISSIDALMSVIQTHFDGTFKTEVNTKLNEHMHELRKRILPDNQIVSSSSPLAILSTVPSGQTPSLNELYKDYPLPGEALLFDIVETTVERTRNHVQLK